MGPQPAPEASTSVWSPMSPIPPIMASMAKLRRRRPGRCRRTSHTDRPSMRCRRSCWVSGSRFHRRLLNIGEFHLVPPATAPVAAGRGWQAAAATGRDWSAVAAAARGRRWRRRRRSDRRRRRRGVLLLHLVDEDVERGCFVHLRLSPASLVLPVETDGAACVELLEGSEDLFQLRLDAIRVGAVIRVVDERAGLDDASLAAEAFHALEGHEPERGGVFAREGTGGVFDGDARGVDVDLQRLYVLSA